MQSKRDLQAHMPVKTLVQADMFKQLCQLGINASSYLMPTVMTPIRCRLSDALSE